MIHIAGGTYAENCTETPWNELFGSGVRAAVALSDLSDQIYLTTYISDADRVTLESTAAHYEFGLRAERVHSTIEFYYQHGLSVPQIVPNPFLIEPAASLMVDAPNVLRFGFLEGDAVVRGERVVYDPQDGHRPKHFHENGSTAERLAVVANIDECVKLAGGKHHDNLELLGKAVLDSEGAEVLVIKRGSTGAVVVTENKVVKVPAYCTSRVWPIGSGDVFSAVFASRWLEEGLDPFDAAKFASLSTAFYCQTKLLPIPKNLEGIFAPPAVTLGADDFPLSRKQVYLAGPFFTMSERWLIEESLMNLKEQGFKVFSPLHNVGYGTASVVVPADIKAIKESDIVFALLDGLDAGTLFEIGYARALGKPVVVFVQNETEGSLKMLEGTHCEIVEDFASAIYRAAWVGMEL